MPPGATTSLPRFKTDLVRTEELEARLNADAGDYVLAHVVPCEVPGSGGEAGFLLVWELSQGYQMLRRIG